MEKPRVSFAWEVMPRHSDSYGFVPRDLVPFLPGKQLLHFQLEAPVLNREAPIAAEPNPSLTRTDSVHRLLQTVV